MEANHVREIIERWAAGVRARDIDAVVSRHSADLLMFDVVEPVRLQGLDAYRRTWLEQFFPWHGGTGRFDLVDLKVSAGVDVAFAAALLEWYRPAPVVSAEYWQGRRRFRPSDFPPLVGVDYPAADVLSAARSQHQPPDVVERARRCNSVHTRPCDQGSTV